MKLTRFLPSLFLSLAAATLSPLQAQTLWTGAVDSSMTDPSNWDNGVPTQLNTPSTIDGTGANSPILGTINGEFQIFNIGTINQTGDTVGVNGGTLSGAVSLNPGTTWNLNGGTFDVSSNYQLRVNTTFIVDGGTIAATGTAGWWVQSVNSDLQILSGTHSLGSNVLNATNGNILIDGASVTADSMLFGNFGNNQNGVVTLQNGASLSLSLSTNQALRNSLNSSLTNSSATFNFGPGASSLTAGGWTPGVSNPLQIDFASNAFNSTFTISNASAFDQTEWEAYWTAGDLTVGGANIGSFSDHFTVTGNTLTMIPEPSTGLLILGSLGMFCLLRRRSA